MLTREKVVPYDMIQIGVIVSRLQKSLLQFKMMFHSLDRLKSHNEVWKLDPFPTFNPACNCPRHVSSTSRWCIEIPSSIRRWRTYVYNIGGDCVLLLNIEHYHYLFTRIDREFIDEKHSVEKARKRLQRAPVFVSHITRQKQLRVDSDITHLDFFATIFSCMLFMYGVVKYFFCCYLPCSNPVSRINSNALNMC